MLVVSVQCAPHTLVVNAQHAPLHWWTGLHVLPLIGGQCSVCSLMLVVNVQCALCIGGQSLVCFLTKVVSALRTTLHWWSMLIVPLWLVLSVSLYIGGQC